ncbi:MAG TPA: alpha/beta hydrolase [Polyangiaceae bacterium]|nr:alpha/beta hydrolase [Polyangiaceae bacterium]
MVATAPSLPLVFFPGAGGKVEFLRPIGERLARRRETRICEYPGLGGAAANAELRSLADLQRHLLASLPEQFDLVTMSMGGVLGLRIALEQPQRVRKLVLMATSGGVDVGALGALDWRDNFQRLQPERPTWFVEDRTDVTQQLGEIRHPTLLIFGDADLIAPAEVGQLLLASLPNARLEIIPGATHDLEIDHPDLIASMIEAHLRHVD